jgi:hypothetical protein
LGIDVEAGDTRRDPNGGTYGAVATWPSSPLKDLIMETLVKTDSIHAV